MCLIAVAIDAHPRWRLVLAGNRDEFHARPTAPAAPLDAEGRRFGGRDLQAGGGWLQVDAGGRVAAVTNVRLGRHEVATRSRGALVADFIANAASVEAYAQTLMPVAAEFGRFNLLLFDSAEPIEAGRYVSNHPEALARSLPTGIHALSNADLDTPWPKTLALHARLATWVARADTLDPAKSAVVAPLFEALADPCEAPDEALPSTGVAIEWERRLSAAFIVGADYGTRASTVVLVGDEGLWFEERRFGPNGVAEGRSALWLPRRNLPVQRRSQPSAS
jgi:uncharacterized protein with NRDE domain